MSYLSFGNFISILLEHTSLNKSDLFDSLMESIIGKHTLGAIDISDKYKFMAAKKELFDYIKTAAKELNDHEKVEKHIEKEIVPKIHKGSIGTLIAELVVCINGDQSIKNEQKITFLKLANTEHLSKFLSEIFLAVIVRNKANEVAEQPNYKEQGKEVITLVDGQIYLNGKKVELPQKLIPPQNLESDEYTYVHELLRAYADAENVPKIDRNNIPPKYLRNFNEQRQNYFNAEAVRRRVRDTGLKDQFDIFVKDTYDAVIDVHDQEYKNGYQRLLSVLDRAANRPQGKSMLEGLIGWIGASEKKGACHILVNNGEITWVVKDE